MDFHFTTADDARILMEKSITIEEKKTIKDLIEFECNNGNSEVMYKPIKSYKKHSALKLFLENNGYYVSIYQDYLIICWTSKEPKELNIDRISKYPN